MVELEAGVGRRDRVHPDLFFKNFTVEYPFLFIWVTIFTERIASQGLLLAAIDKSLALSLAVNFYFTLYIFESVNAEKQKRVFRVDIISHFIFAGTKDDRLSSCVVALMGLVNKSV